MDFPPGFSAPPPPPPSNPPPSYGGTSVEPQNDSMHLEASANPALDALPPGFAPPPPPPPPTLELRQPNNGNFYIYYKSYTAI